jgi:acyl carrier protein
VDDVGARLTKCFLAVFPKIKPDEARTASATALGEWDSVASVTLFTLIEEEFDITLDMDALDHFSSFESIRQHIEKNLA